MTKTSVTACLHDAVVMNTLKALMEHELRPVKAAVLSARSLNESLLHILVRIEGRSHTLLVTEDEITSGQLYMILKKRLGHILLSSHKSPKLLRIRQRNAADSMLSENLTDLFGLSYQLMLWDRPCTEDDLKELGLTFEEALHCALHNLADGSPSTLTTDDSYYLITGENMDTSFLIFCHPFLHRFAQKIRAEKLLLFPVSPDALLVSDASDMKEAVHTLLELLEYDPDSTDDDRDDSPEREDASDSSGSSSCIPGFYLYDDALSATLRLT